MGDHDFLYANISGTVYDATDLLRRNMTGGKNGIIILDKCKDATQLRKQYSAVIRHTNTAASAALSAVIFCIHCRQPNNFSTHFKCSLYCFGIQSARFIIKNQSAVHDKGIALKRYSIISVAQCCTRNGGAVMSLDYDGSCSGVDSSVSQFQIVISSLTNIRRRVDMHINDIS